MRKSNSKGSVKSNKTSHSCRVPTEAIIWMTLHASSNADLAILTNICQSWREIVAATTCAYIEQRLKEILPIDGEEQKRSRHGKGYRSRRVSVTSNTYLAHKIISYYKRQQNSQQCQQLPTKIPLHLLFPFSTLLLPSMMMESHRRHYHQNKIIKKEKSNLQQDDQQENETFCLSWFTPKNIQFTIVPISTMHSSSHNPDCAGDSDSNSFSSIDRIANTRRAAAASSSYLRNNNNNSQLPHNLNGSLTMQAFPNFPMLYNDEPKMKKRPSGIGFGCGIDEGYLKQFLSGDEEAQQEIDHLDHNSNSSISSQGTTSSLFSHDESCQACCVRWRSVKEANEILKPFGYSYFFLKKVFTMTSQIKSHQEEQDMEKAMNKNFGNSTYAVRGAIEANIDFFHLLLPSLKQTTKTKYEIQSNNLLTHKAKKILKRCLPRVMPTSTIHRQRSIQFLNAEKTRAVCLKTPPFDCGVVSQPITLFCVGIATEDGCFVSGLKHTFELGHLHSATLRDSLVDMSSICISTKNESVPQAKKPIRKRASTTAISFTNNNSHAIQHVWRGNTGPGMWHCYTVIFNESSSIVRVDGRTEHCESNLTCGTGTLDGLTIGSDDKFDMSLCFGNGDNGEGEGSISELALFKGVLTTKDIEAMEYYLMKKHGIMAHPNSLEEEEFTRDANALLLLSIEDYDDAELEKHVPLRFLTKHRSVAWVKKNPVTGNIIPVTKIGSRITQDPESSDW